MGACLKRRVGRRAALDNRDLGRDSGRDERDGPGGIIRLVLAHGGCSLVGNSFDDLDYINESAN